MVITEHEFPCSHSIVKLGWENAITVMDGKTITMIRKVGFVRLL
jgi:hypothetical protein